MVRVNGFPSDSQLVRTGCQRFASRGVRIGRPHSTTLAVTGRGAACSNSDLRARTATRRCLPTRLRRASAPTSARSAPLVSKTSWRTSARIALVDLFPDQSGRRKTGKATIFSVRTRQAPKSSTGRSIRQSMPAFRPQSRRYPPTNGRGAKMTANKRIKADLRKRAFARLLCRSYATLAADTGTA